MRERDDLMAIIGDAPLASLEDLRTRRERFEEATLAAREQRRQAREAATDWRELDLEGTEFSREIQEFLDQLQAERDTRILQVYQARPDLVVALARKTYADSLRQHIGEASCLALYYRGCTADELFMWDGYFFTKKIEPHKRIDEIAIVEPPRALTDPDEIVINVVVRNDRYGQRTIQFVPPKLQETLTPIEEQAE